MKPNIVKKRRSMNRKKPKVTMQNDVTSSTSVYVRRSPRQEAKIKGAKISLSNRIMCSLCIDCNAVKSVVNRKGQMERLMRLKKKLEFVGKVENVGDISDIGKKSKVKYKSLKQKKEAAGVEKLGSVFELSAMKKERNKRTEACRLKCGAEMCTLKCHGGDLLPNIKKFRMDGMKHSKENSSPLLLNPYNLRVRPCKRQTWLTWDTCSSVCKSDIISVIGTACEEKPLLAKEQNYPKKKLLPAIKRYFVVVSTEADTIRVSHKKILSEGEESEEVVEFPITWKYGMYQHRKKRNKDRTIHFKYCEQGPSKLKLLLQKKRFKSPAKVEVHDKSDSTSSLEVNAREGDWDFLDFDYLLRQGEVDQGLRDASMEETCTLNYENGNGSKTEARFTPNTTKVNGLGASTFQLTSQVLKPEENKVSLIYSPTDHRYVKCEITLQPDVKALNLNLGDGNDVWSVSTDHAPGSAYRSCNNSLATKNLWAMGSNPPETASSSADAEPAPTFTNPPMIPLGFSCPKMNSYSNPIAFGNRRSDVNLDEISIERDFRIQVENLLSELYAPNIDRRFAASSRLNFIRQFLL